MREDISTYSFQAKSDNIQKMPKGVLLMFVLWPFSAFLFALKHYRSAWAAKVFMLYAAFFGFTFVLFGDAVRVALALDDMSNLGFNFGAIFSKYFTGDSAVLDVVYRLITMVVAFFTNDYRFLMAILTFIMAYYLARSVWFLTQRLIMPIGLFGGLLLIAFSVTIQLWYVGGRWNLAALVFSYGILKYFQTRSLKYFLLTIFSVFIHWSFYFALPILFIYILLKNRTLAYYILFFISFFFALMNMETVQVIFEDYAPEAVQQTRSGYLQEGYIKAVASSGDDLAWYVKGHINALSYFILVTVSYLFFLKLKTIKTNILLFNLFNFMLLFLGITNALSFIPSMSRFITVGHWFFLAIFFLFMYNAGGKVHPLLKLSGYFVLIIFIIVRFRVSMDYLSIWTILGNPIYVYFVENSTPLIDIVKMLF